MTGDGRLKSVDWGIGRLVASALLLSIVGLTAIWFLWPPNPAKSGVLGSTFIRQVIFVCAGAVMMIVAALPHPAMLRRGSYLFFVAGLATLGALLGYVDPMRGTRGWFAVGPFTVQPAEFVKLATVLALARFLSYGRWKDGLPGFAGACVLAAAPAALILMQPDLGSAILFVPILLAMLVTAGTSRRYLAGAALVLAISMPAAYFTVLKPYQRERILAFFNPDSVSRDKRYQTDHALNATASGGFLGRGLGGSAASYPFYIPDRHTDFVFSAIGEELGFVGCSLVLLLYATILYELFRIAWTTKEPFGRLVVVGIAAFLFSQVTINVGMTVGVLPTTGLTLPFVSYGGSSLVTCFLAVGMAVGVARHKVQTLRRGS